MKKLLEIALAIASGVAGLHFGFLLFGQVQARYYAQNPPVQPTGVPPAL